MWRTIYSGKKASTYRLLSHWLALVTSLNWNESPTHFKLYIIPPSTFFYSHLHSALSPWRDYSTLFSSSGSQLPLSSLLQPHSLPVIFPPHHVPGHQACSSTPIQPHWSVLLFILIAGNFHSSHSFTFIHSSLLIQQLYLYSVHAMFPL